LIVPFLMVNLFNARTPYISENIFYIYYIEISIRNIQLRGPFEKFVDLCQCAAVMQREAVTIMPSCSGGGNVVVA
jgi:hypothetical protein